MRIIVFHQLQLHHSTEQEAPMLRWVAPHEFSPFPPERPSSEETTCKQSYLCRCCDAFVIDNSVAEYRGHFFATIGGSLSQQFSANSSFRQFSISDAVFGIGYTLSPNSSFRILGGEEAFDLPHNSYYTTFHDTTFIHDGTPYANILGEVNTVSGVALTRVYWLGGSYRYSPGDRGIRPFAEIMAAGSTDGLLMHESIGAEFFISERFNLDLFAQGSELLPQNSVWLTKAGVSLDASYAF